MAASVLNRNLSRVILHTRYIRDIGPVYRHFEMHKEMTQGRKYLWHIKNK